MVSTNQGMDERRIALIGPQRQHRPKGIGVVLNADAALGSVGRTEIGSDPEVIAEVSGRGEIESVGVDTAFQMLVLIAAEEFCLRVIPGLSSQG